MAVIHVPRPPESAWDPNRKASSLLRTQAEHAHIAERRLPERYRAKIYVNAIQTEGEVAEYIEQVTAGIIRAHEDARKRRARSAARPGQLLSIAAEAENESPSRSKAGAARGNRATGSGKSKARKAK